jgi:hypothetical protein
MINYFLALPLLPGGIELAKFADKNAENMQISLLVYLL